MKKFITQLITWIMKLVSKKRRGEVVTKRVIREKPKVKTVVKIEKTVALRIPKTFRRMERTRNNRDIAKRNDGTLVGMGGFSIGTGHVVPHVSKTRKKFKGWQRENRRYRKSA